MIWDLDPELVRLFGVFPIRYYSLLFVAGLLLGYRWVRYSYVAEGRSLEQLALLTRYILVGMVAGARLGHCLLYEPGYYLAHPAEMVLPFSFGPDGITFTGYQGLASHGGAIGVLIAILLFCWKTRSSPWPVLDKLAVAVPLTGACIRLGNFMNSEIIGRPFDGPWAVVFARVDPIARHPAQLYEAGAYLGLFVLLLTLYFSKKGKWNRGVIFGLFLVLMFCIRFTLEFFKIHQVAFEVDMTLNMGQWLSLPFIGLGLAIIGGRCYYNPGKST